MSTRFLLGAALVASCLSTGTASAAQISGRVVDAEGNAPIGGARVLLRASTNGPFLAATSLANGTFSRQVPAGTYFVEVNAPGGRRYVSSPVRATVSEPSTALGTFAVRDHRVTTLLLLRHADKAQIPPEDPPLTAAGMARAQDLARVAAHAGVIAIFHSQLLRSRQTATPLANALGLTPVQYTYSGTDVAALAQQLRALPRGSKALVVAHGDSLGPLIVALGGTANACPLQGDDFDNLCVVERMSGETTRVMHLQYGVASPSP